MSFDGSGSTGNNLSYSWDFGAGADATNCDAVNRQYGNDRFASIVRPGDKDRYPDVLLTTMTVVKFSDTVTVTVLSIEAENGE